MTSQRKKELWKTLDSISSSINKVPILHGSGRKDTGRKGCRTQSNMIRGVAYGASSGVEEIESREKAEQSEQQQPRDMESTEYRQ